MTNERVSLEGDSFCQGKKKGCSQGPGRQPFRKWFSTLGRYLVIASIGVFDRGAIGERGRRREGRRARGKREGERVRVKEELISNGTEAKESRSFFFALPVGNKNLPKRTKNSVHLIAPTCIVLARPPLARTYNDKQLLRHWTIEIPLTFNSRPHRDLHRLRPHTSEG